MSLCLDTSFVAAIVFEEANSREALAYWRRSAGDSIISDWASVEFGAVVSRYVRMRVIERSTADELTESFDALRRTSVRHTPSRDDLQLAAVLVRDFDLKLQAADALHLAASLNLQATLVTFDKQLIAAARSKGVAVAPE